MSSLRRNQWRGLSKSQLFSALIAFLCSLTLTACGGGSMGNHPPQESSTISSVSVTCTPSTVTTSGTPQCSAAVQGTGSYSSAVTWSASSGTITSSGLLTAPAAVGTVTVTATSTQDTTKSGMASVTVQAAAATITSVVVTCNPASILANGTSQCSATVQGKGSYTSAVTWSTSTGTITSTGLLTASAAAGTVTVTATSMQDTTKSGTASVTVQAPTSTISSVVVTCNPASITVSATSQCSATVQGMGSFSSAVTWSASGGSIRSSGLLTAPAAAGTVTVIATSLQDTTKSGMASVTIQAAATAITSVMVTCNPASVAVNATSQCTAAVQGTGSFSSAVTWSASSGTISLTGLLTAPAAVGAVVVTATSTQDTTKSGAASVTVQAAAPTITSISVACTPAIAIVDTTSQCSATVQGTGSYSSAVTWSASSGVIDQNGLFTAPSDAATVTVTATSTEDTTKSSAAAVTVQFQTPPSKHVILVMEENQNYSTVVGQTSLWPNLNNLISAGALATNYYGDSHPSIGNYFMLTTGQLLTTNDSSTMVWNVDNIARHMIASSIPFRIYAEGITQGYLGGNTGPYLIRHNPFAMLSDIASNAQVANRYIYPFSQFAVDLANGALPEFSFIVPDVNDDAHNGTPQQADTWLQTNVVTPLSTYSAFQLGGDGVLIVDFDEAKDSDTTNGGGHVPSILWGPDVKVGYTQQSATVYQHQSMLRTMMEALQLANPPGAAATAPSMGEFFVGR